MVVYGGDAFGMANHRSAQDLALFNLAGLVAIPSFSDPSISEVQFHDTPWRGDNPANTGSVDEGPLSDGTTFIWDTENRTDAWAVYLQGEWQINDIWALTLGVRYAERFADRRSRRGRYGGHGCVWRRCVRHG